MRWQDEARCANPPCTPHWFDVELDGGERETTASRMVRHAAARAACRQCPVAQQCLDDALSDPTAEGIRAGYLFESELPYE